MPIDTKPKTITFYADYDGKMTKISEIPPLGVKPFELWIEARQDDLWEAIKRSEDYPDELIVEIAFLEKVKREWENRNA